MHGPQKTQKPTPINDGLHATGMPMAALNWHPDHDGRLQYLPSSQVTIPGITLSTTTVLLCLTDIPCSRIIFLFFFSLSVLSHHNHSFRSLDLVILLAPPNLTALPYVVFVWSPPLPSRLTTRAILYPNIALKHEMINTASMTCSFSYFREYYRIQLRRHLPGLFTVSKYCSVEDVLSPTFSSKGSAWSCTHLLLLSVVKHATLFPSTTSRGSRQSNRPQSTV